MRLSRTHPVPADLALLYEFVNSLDLRRFVHDGVRHTPCDELATASQLELWMRQRGLLDDRARLDRDEHRRALELRSSLRAFLQLAPADRRRDPALATLVNAATADFPLIVQVLPGGKIGLRPPPAVGGGGLGTILAELQHAAHTGRLDRLKTCAAEECRWVFYDRSRPGSRRWCSAARCGNREKTRAYRRRQRHAQAQST